MKVTKNGHTYKGFDRYYSGRGPAKYDVTVMTKVKGAPAIKAHWENTLRDGDRTDANPRDIPFEFRLLNQIDYKTHQKLYASDTDLDGKPNGNKNIWYEIKVP